MNSLRAADPRSAAARTPRPDAEATASGRASSEDAYSIASAQRRRPAGMSPLEGDHSGAGASNLARLTPSTRQAKGGAFMAEFITLYGSSDSGNCLKGKWVAERLGVPIKWIEINTFSGETRTPEFLAINPAGQVPVAV